ncbi:hypothetical protein D9615_007650 [Tricholomella constricta]|uniref:Uncharacterized protein n=1 Tax=Tricholomella constricta TaxID=117010 RepID=A0A8H5H3M5_9AGAR|nr:hypothetical protein D9615_007650 [Tricholomella constricta]
MIIDEKVIMQPPPSYGASSAGLPPFPSTTSRLPHTLTSLPPHLLLHIVYATFPQTPLPDQATIERQRKTLYWLSVALRLVDRTLYVTCMHVLRSTHIPAYDALIRAPYSSDPFPLLAPPSDPVLPPPSPYSSQMPTPTASPLNTLQRETAVLDRFIALKVREDVWADDSELHLERDEAYKDLFDLAQPRARLEDLLRIYGIRDGVISAGPSLPPASASPCCSSGSKTTNTGKPRTATANPQLTDSTSSSPRISSASHSKTPSPGPNTSTSFLSSLFSRSKISSPSISPSPSPKPAPRPRITPVPFHTLSVSFSPRQVGLVLHPARRTIVSTPRTRDERLEVAVMRLVKELRAWLEEGG